MNRLSPHEELEELSTEIATKEHVAARKMREVQDLIEELNGMKADREVVAEYVRTHPPKPECSVEDCVEPTVGRGLCSRHYQAVRRAARS